MRPLLHSKIDINQFKSHYYLKNELRDFCRQHHLNNSGSKQELEQRIEAFLTGSPLPVPQYKSARRKHSSQDQELSLSTVITKDHRCSEAVRIFFKAHTNQKFHFSLFARNYFKQNIGKTYQDFLNAWFDEQHRRVKFPSVNAISPQFKYNQFIRDFFADPLNKGKTRQDAIHAWNHVKNMSGAHKYVRQDHPTH